MDRETLEEKALLEYINTKLHSLVFPIDYRTYTFTDIVRLALEDREGSNWSGANFECKGVVDNKCKPVLENIIREARSKYNVK